VPPLRPGVIVLVVAIVAGAVLIVFTSGWRSLVVYGFFVGLAALLAFAMGLAGGILTDVSRGRFDRHDR
jgi:hypothetical protein